MWLNRNNFLTSFSDAKVLQPETLIWLHASRAKQKGNFVWVVFTLQTKYFWKACYRLKESGLSFVTLNCHYPLKKLFMSLREVVSLSRHWTLAVYQTMAWHSRLSPRSRNWAHDVSVLFSSNDWQWTFCFVGRDLRPLSPASFRP